MRRRSRTRRVLKWVGLVLAVAMLVGSAASCVAATGIGYVHQAFDVRFVEGVVYVDSPSVLAVAGYSAGWQSFGFMTLTTGSIPHFCRLPAAHAAGVEVPLGLPVVLIVLASAYLFWTDRHQVALGQCRNCGYDLTGNVSGVCPECGEPTADRSSSDTD